MKYIKPEIEKYSASDIELLVLEAAETVQCGGDYCASKFSS